MALKTSICILFVALAGTVAIAQDMDLKRIRLASPNSNWVIASTLISPDGRSVAYVSNADSGCVVYVNDTRIAAHPDILASGFVWSPNGKRLAYGAKVGDKWAMFVDGKASKEYEDIGAPQFDSSSRQVAYVAVRDGKTFLVLDEKEVGPYDGVAECSFSNNGKVAFFAVKGGKLFLVRDTSEMPIQTSNENLGKRQLSPDHSQFAYEVLRPDGVTLFVNDKAVQSSGIANILGFSPDSKSAVYITELAPGRRVLTIGETTVTLPPVFFSCGVVWSPDSKHYIYGSASGDNDAQLVLDGRTIGSVNGAQTFGTPVFSPDGKHCGVPVRTKVGWNIVVDDRVFSGYDLIESSGVHFSTTGERFAAWAYRGPTKLLPGSKDREAAGGKWILLVDGQERFQFDHGCRVPTFSPSGKRFLACGNNGGTLIDRDKCDPVTRSLAVGDGGGKIIHNGTFSLIVDERSFDEVDGAGAVCTLRDWVWEDDNTLWKVIYHDGAICRVVGSLTGR